MRRRCIILILASLGLMLAGIGEAVAQAPVALYPYDRAYQHFLGSRYSYRTYSAISPGSRFVMRTPFVRQMQFIQPSISRQRITPFGYDRFDLIPGFGSAIVTPFGFGSYYMPGFGHGLVVPNGGQPFEYYTR